MQKRLIVIGGGAAGFFCAINAARLRPDLKVILLEKTGKLLSKVKVSGGGRCNTTHACFDIPDLVRKYPRGQNFIKKAFHQFAPKDTIDWFAERGVVLKTEADGRMFPITDNSQTIIDCLLKEADKYGVEIILHADVKIIESTPEGFQLQTPNTQLLTNFLCIASGGFPKMAMFNWLTSLGHSIEAPVPSLFTFNMPGNKVTELMGVTVEKAAVKISGTRLLEEGPLLITHWGMSGPVILRLSAWGARQLADLDYQFTIAVNWLPDYREPDLRNDWPSFRMEYAAQKMGKRNPFGLPSRLWVYLLHASGIDPETRWSELPAKEQNKLIGNLCAQAYPVKGKTTFKEEFVTCGGIRLSEIDPQYHGKSHQKRLVFCRGSDGCRRHHRSPMPRI